MGDWHLLATREEGIELLQELVSRIGSAVDDRVVVFEGDIDLLSFHELGQMVPVVHLLVKFESVVELVHLDTFRIVSLENLSVDPTVREITLWVGDLVSQVKRLEPECYFTRQSGSLHICFEV